MDISKGHHPISDLRNEEEKIVHPSLHFFLSEKGKSFGLHFQYPLCDTLKLAPWGECNECDVEYISQLNR